MRVEFVVLANVAVAIDGDMGVEVAALGDGDIRADGAERADLNAFIHIGFGRNDGGGMNHREKMS